MNDSHDHVQTVDKPQISILGLHRAGKTWREISDENYGGLIPAGTLASYAKGRPVKNPEHRTLLGLPVRVEVDGKPCECGCGRFFPDTNKKRRWFEKACANKEYRKRRKEAGKQ
jgi:hypothetical protein